MLEMAQRPSYTSPLQRDSFCHERLKLAENSIRLFQVQHSGGKNDPVSLRITQYSSHRRPPYRAISYTWGSATNLYQVLVNGRVFRVHCNLWNLLYHLRLRKETDFFWADALCIDQANLRERNFHVQLMGRIYDQAKSVIVWLGLPSRDRTEIRAMDFIKDVTLFRKAHGDTILAKTYMAKEIRHRWQTLQRMCQNQYWTRTWIVQEFIRAPRIEVVCGTASVNWEEFENLLLTIQNTPFNQHEIVVDILQSRPARLTLRRRGRTASTLHELLGEYHDSMCTEQRDKVYGILGLASDCGADEETGLARGMIPDYNKHIVEVYLDVIACIEKSLKSKTLLPSAANLVRKTLLLSENDFAEFARCKQPTQQGLPKFTVMPEYVGTVSSVLPPWTSIRDMKTQLAGVDWGQYLGYEMRPVRSGVGRRASIRVSQTTIPEDMLQNVANMAETETDVAYLYNYPNEAHLTVSPMHISLHMEDKQLYHNPKREKPCIIVEHNEANNTLRLGLACTNTKRGDLILQFRGLDTTVICRQIRNDIVLVGKALMAKHSQLQHEHNLDVVCIESPWLSRCLRSYNPNNVQLETDALSLAELLTRR